MSGTVEVDRVASSFTTGRVRNAAGPANLELWVDEAFEYSETLGPEDPEPREFRIPLPPLCFDAQEHWIEIRFAGARLGQQFRSEYEGFLDPFSDNLLTGWVLDVSRPNCPVKVEIDLNGTMVGHTVADCFRADLLARHGWGGRNGLEFVLPELPGMDRSFVLRARVAGTDIDLQKSPVLSLARPRLIRAAQQFNVAFHYLEQCLLWNRSGRGPDLNLTEAERLQFAGLLLEGSNVADILELRRRFLRPMQAQLTEHYARRDYATLGTEYPESLPRRSRSAHRDRPVDVIVPVYAGYRETESCLASILRSPAGCRYELICVLDNPDDQELRSLLKRLAKQHAHITLLENESTKGFAGAVNRAMRLHRDRDVLILHADCEVHGDWLGRLQHAAYQGIGAGLVNPMTDHGDFLSYPDVGTGVPADASFETLDTFAKRVNLHVTVPIPGAMGFCLYIRRGCLDDLGFFHDDQPSGGYYAEKYFSIHAAAQGWRSILASDVFVKHSGFTSFAGRDQAVEAAREAFERWCPFYQDSVTDFLVDDPVLPIRRELDLARLQAAGVNRYCFISHSSGGGTERHLQDLSDALALDGKCALVLYSLPGRRVLLQAQELDDIENLQYRIDGEWRQLLHDLAKLRVEHFHIHSNVDVARELFTLPELLGVPYDITVHDYGWFCPRVNLVNHSGEYCGEPAVKICETCTGTDVTGLRERSQAELAGARRVFCPSADTRIRIEKHFELANVTVRPHPEWIAEPQGAREASSASDLVVVATLGRLSGHKGLRVVRECAAHALEWALPLRFVVIGGTSDDEAFKGLTNVEITGPYQEDEVDGLIDRHGVQVAFLPSVLPETYSYTLSIALRNGLVPVAFDLGAIAERMRRSRTGTLLPLGTPAALVNEALLKAANQKQTTAAAGRGVRRGTGYLNMLRDYYGLH